MFSTLFAPDTGEYLIAGYIVVTLVVGLYITSLVIRWKNALQAFRLYTQEFDGE